MLPKKLADPKKYQEFCEVYQPMLERPTTPKHLRLFQVRNAGLKKNPDFIAISAASSQAASSTATPDLSKAAAVSLPGVPEQPSARRSRWQPLFRDPSFGGSIEASPKVHLKIAGGVEG